MFRNRLNGKYQIEAVQFSFGGRFFPDRLDKPHAIELQSVTLEK